MSDNADIADGGGDLTSKEPRFIILAQKIQNCHNWAKTGPRLPISEKVKNAQNPCPCSKKTWAFHTKCNLGSEK